MTKLRSKTTMVLMVGLLLAMALSTGAAMAGSEDKAEPAVVSGSYGLSVSTNDGAEKCLTKVEDGKVSVSYDDGETWEEIDPAEAGIVEGQLPNADAGSIPALDGAVETCIVMETEDGKVKMSTDGGETWQEIENFSTEDGEKPGMIQFNSDGENHQFSTDGGETWQDAQLTEMRKTI